jgi:hypothetical protein
MHGQTASSLQQNKPTGSNSQRPAANSQQYTASNRQPAANSNIGATKAKELSKPGRITRSGYGTHTLLAGKL